MLSGETWAYDIIMQETYETVLFGKILFSYFYMFQLDIDPKKYFENVLTWNKKEMESTLLSRGRPFSRFKWSMSPTAINAYYSPDSNKIGKLAVVLDWNLIQSTLIGRMAFLHPWNFIITHCSCLVSYTSRNYETKILSFSTSTVSMKHAHILHIYPLLPGWRGGGETQSHGESLICFYRYVTLKKL